MDLVTANDLVRLSEQRGGIRASLFLPTHRAGPRTARNRIRLKNLLQLARRTLRDDGVPAAAVDTAFQPAEQFVEDRCSSHRPSDGLAVFLGPEEFRMVRVPLRLPELVTIGQRFFVRPLLPLLVAGGRFHVLSLSQDTIRLYSGTRFRLEEVELDGLPLAMWLTVPRRRDQAHAFLADRGGAGRRTVFFGSAEQDEKLLVYKHFQRVDRDLRDLLGDQRAPLVLAGVRSTQALYRRANTHPHLLPEGIDGSPLSLTPSGLHEKAWPLVEPVLRAQEAAAAGTYRALEGTGLTSDDLPTILAAAEHGRVEDLFLPTDFSTPAVAPSDRLVSLTDPPDRADQSDRAAVETLRNGGNVYALPAARMPSGSPVAATFRY